MVLPEPFGYWHEGATYDESEFFKHSESGDVACEECVKLHTEQTVRALLATERAGLQALGCMLPEGYKSGIQTGAQVSLFFESQSNATAWLEAFMDHCEGAAPSVPQGWMPIESAPKDKTILLGYRNSNGHWRTLRGEYMLDEHMQAGYLQGASEMVAAGLTTPERASELVQAKADEINRVPAYVRQAVKMLTKALRDHEKRSGIVEAGS
ncbi:hypothetical protein [Diaphorobacter caeni]|uniref:hypothetical protein n=1 Tax=Diaphorobacter caeni TaxID=2784387 RepID=UPI00188F1B8D|nr:hypothetical protein [Diaphorobacter caeni]MBF5007640.1 hypothetical protein [Diaphorobacter caeni]